MDITTQTGLGSSRLEVDEEESCWLKHSYPLTLLLIFVSLDLMFFIIIIFKNYLVFEYKFKKLIMFLTMYYIIKK